MAALEKKERRDVIPRWRPFKNGHLDLDARPSSERKDRVASDFKGDPESLLERYRKGEGQLFLVESFSSALALGDREAAAKAAEELQNIDLRTKPLLRSEAKRVLGGALGGADLQFPQDCDSAFVEIAKAKRLVRIYPRSALAWLDLAFLYATVGQLSMARPAVGVAAALEPHHRLVTRAASRFLIHDGQKDAALFVLERSKFSKVDPWIVSAHIAASGASGRRSQLISVGRKMFKSGDFRPDEVSELGSALATIEAENGNYRLAQKWASTALKDPTENAVAQVSYIESRDGLEIGESKAALTLPSAFEARTFEASDARQWIESCEQAERWLSDQPFSSRPAIHGSFVAATFLDDFALAHQFSSNGYRANPKDPTVANNYCVTLAAIGQVEHARRVFEANFPTNSRSEAVRATEGLIAYREGNLDLARDAYAIAKCGFESLGDLERLALASIYQAREEFRLGGAGIALDVLREAEVRMAGAQGPIVDRLKSQLSKVRAASG